MIRPRTRSAALPRALRAALPRALRAALLAVSLLGCNVVECQRGSHERTLRKAGLQPRDLALGAARVHLWEGGGAGRALVLVHGFGGDGVWTWHPQVQALAGRRLVIPDLLWFGGSRSSTESCSLADQARALLALHDHLKLGAADWVGISYGGLVVQELARERPQAVRRLVLMDSPGRSYDRADYQALCARFGVTEIGRVLVPEDVAGVRRLLTLAYHDPPWMPDFAARQALRELYGPRRREQLRLVDGLLGELGARAARPGAPLAAPTLILWGRDDPVFPLALGERLARELGSAARLQVIDRTRHAPNLERPAEVNRALLEFLGDGD